MRALPSIILLLSALVLGANAESLGDALDAVVPESFLAEQPVAGHVSAESAVQDGQIQAESQEANAGSSFPAGDGFSVEEAFDDLVKNTADRMSDTLRPPATIGTPSKEELDATDNEAQQKEHEEEQLLHHNAAQALVDKEKNKLKQAEDVLSKAKKGEAVTVPAADAPDATPSTKATASDASKPLLTPLASTATQSCESTCVDKYLQDQDACKQLCATTDSRCQFKCGQPLQECACKCQSSSKEWMQDHGGEYHCWTLQGEANSAVELAMMAAENKALAAGLSQEEARSKALEVEKVLSLQQTEQTSDSSKTPSDDTELLQLRQWMHAMEGGMGEMK